MDVALSPEYIVQFHGLHATSIIVVEKWEGQILAIGRELVGIFLHAGT
jgi:hypothetical protein